MVRRRRSPLSGCRKHSAWRLNQLVDPGDERRAGEHLIRPGLLGGPPQVGLNVGHIGDDGYASRFQAANQVDRVHAAQVQIEDDPSAWPAGFGQGEIGRGDEFQGLAGPAGRLLDLHAEDQIIHHSENHGPFRIARTRIVI